jgi:uncharacterized protein YqeY
MSGKSTPNPVERCQSMLRRDLRLAIKARRADEARTLRCLLAAIDNAQAVPVGDLHEKYVVRPFADGSAEAPRIELSEADLERLLLGEAQDRIGAARQCEQVGRMDRANSLRAEADIVKRHFGNP